MSSIVKSVSLDPESANIARRIPNFSKFVRECLKRYAALNGGEPICPVADLVDTLGQAFCVPARGRVCLKHWPDGPAPLHDWKEYRQMCECDPDRLLDYWPFLEAFPSGGPEEWIAHRAQITNPPLIEFDDIKISGNAKPKKPAPKRSFLQRLGAQIRGD